jgi:GNAT superfamily N-acetyltransferase
VRWDAEAAQRIAAHFKALGPNERIAGAWNGGNKPVGVAIVELVKRQTLVFAILNDILVAKDARLRGVGERMVRFIEEELRAEGVEWLFLESGLKNERAHKFFERLDYHETSRIFAKRLAG